jgi:CheY-like chemotaxis protein
MKRLLWTDDDCNDFLEPLGRTLRRGGFDLTKATNYQDAMKKIEGGEKFESALLDIILPHAGGAGALAPDLGINLATHLAISGVGAISFLTVVRQDEVAEKYKELKTRFEGVRFEYLDKTQLLEPGTIERMINFLTPAE